MIDTDGAYGTGFGCMFIIIIIIIIVRASNHSCKDGDIFFKTISVLIRDFFFIKLPILFGFRAFAQYFFILLFLPYCYCFCLVFCFCVFVLSLCLCAGFIIGTCAVQPAC